MLPFKKHSQAALRAARTFRAASSVTDEYVVNYLSSLDSPRSLMVWLLYHYSEHDQLTELSIDPNHYNDSSRFRDDYAATHFLAKADFLKTSFDKEQVALNKFSEFEDLCGLTNRRFSNLLLDPDYSGSNVWLLNATIRKIEQVLGDFCGEEWVDNAGWGPGVSNQIKGSDCSAINKFHSESGITRDLHALVGGELFSAAYPLWASSRPDLRPESEPCFEVGNVIITVPKSSKTDRVIAVEPGLNLWFQKGLGTMIRRRLLRAGIDLNSQTRNQHLAFRASKDASLATVDFSSASDSISARLVEALLPPRWFAVLDASRCRYGISKGVVRTWNKFSSMGNGFTFELESLIFFAAASAVCDYQGLPKTDVSVFGDDVILPSKAFDLFSSFSRFLGFRVNATKSFSSGRFFESCGSHFWGGRCCKPVYLKNKLTDISSIYKAANAARLFAARTYGFGCDRRQLTTWRSLYKLAPLPLRFKVPESAGDTGFISNFDEAVPSRPRHGIEGYRYMALTDRAIKLESDHLGVLLSRLWYRSDQEYGNSRALRGRTRRVVVRPVVQQWCNLGPWL